MSNNFLNATVDGSVTKKHELDLVILSALPDSGGPINRGVAVERGYTNFNEVYRDGQNGLYIKERLSAVDERHKEWGIWPQACHSFGAKVVVTRGGDKEEIASCDLTKSKLYKTVVSTTFSRYFFPDAEIPGRFGVVMSPDYLRIAQKYVTGSSQLSLGVKNSEDSCLLQNLPVRNGEAAVLVV